MKTTKMNLVNIQGKLSRTEMKSIMAGSARVVACTAMPGYSISSPGSCTGTQSACQAAADAWCTNANHCAGCVVG